MGKYKIQKPNKGIVVGSAILVLGMLIGASLTYVISNDKTARLQSKYNLLAKRILIDKPNDILLDFTSLQAKLELFVSSNLAKNQASVYFEYLPTGTSIGINEKEQLVGASLLKTPLAINLYKSAEEGKVDLDAPIALKKEWLNSQYGELYKKGVGYQASLRQLTEIMLTQSDNTAALAIYSTLAGVMPIDQKLLSFVDSEYEVNKDQSLRLGAESYSQILKCLYFTCYLNKDSSQEILGYLTKSTATNRLKLYLPDSVNIAHKIGTYDPEVGSGTPSVQSDCGITYVQNRNYLLCVMIKGDDPQASRTIGDISKLVYNFVSTSK